MFEMGRFHRKQDSPEKAMLLALDDIVGGARRGVGVMDELIEKFPHQEEEIMSLYHEFEENFNRAMREDPLPQELQGLERLNAFCWHAYTSNRVPLIREQINESMMILINVALIAHEAQQCGLERFIHSMYQMGLDVAQKRRTPDILYLTQQNAMPWIKGTNIGHSLDLEDLAPGTSVMVTFNHDLIAMPSLYPHFTPLHPHCTLTVPSLCPRCTLAVPAPYPHRTLTVRSLSARTMGA